MSAAKDLTMGWLYFPTPQHWPGGAKTLENPHLRGAAVGCCRYPVSDRHCSGPAISSAVRTSWPGERSIEMLRHCLKKFRTKYLAEPWFPRGEFFGNGVLYVALAKAVTNSNQVVRLEAVRTLGELNGIGYIDPNTITPGLTDESLAVRTAATNSLEQINKTPQIGRLLRSSLPHLASDASSPTRDCRIVISLRQTPFALRKRRHNPTCPVQYRTVPFQSYFV